jgi:hypothetical protein
MYFDTDVVVCTQQDIFEASDEATRKYFDEKEEKDRDPAVVKQLMRVAEKAKATSYRGKFSKYAAVANPKLEDKFLEVVSVIL